MVTGSIEPRTLSPSVSCHGCLERVWAAVSCVDVLVCSIESERRQPGVRAVDWDYWRPGRWLDGTLVQLGEFLAQCVIQLHELRECPDGGNRGEQSEGL
jgi:hypothetical protein